MIYDVQRLVKNCLTALPVACEGVSIEALENRIPTDLLGGRQPTFV